MSEWMTQKNNSNQSKIGAYFLAVRSLYREGFVAIAWDPNITTHPIGFYDYFEIVFKRSDMGQCRTKWGEWGPSYSARQMCSAWFLIMQPLSSGQRIHNIGNKSKQKSKCPKTVKKAVINHKLHWSYLKLVDVFKVAMMTNIVNKN